VKLDPSEEEAVDDSTVLGHIEKLVEEERELLRSREGKGPDADEHRRLEEVKVELDRCWDLLRQRRAQEEFGRDPDQATERDSGTVEGYLQ
jgi:Protein of unknown function (DUF2630)